MAETDRKSKRKAPPKVDEDAEPTGFRKLAQNPWFILIMIAVTVAFLVIGIFALSQFLSTGRIDWFD